MTSPLTELVERVKSLCKECAKSSFAMGNYGQLAEAIGTIKSDSQSFLLVKLGKAARNEHGTLAGGIKVQLVHCLIRQIKDIVTLEGRTEIESLLKSWLDISNENIYRIAFSETERFAFIEDSNMSASHSWHYPRSKGEDQHDYEYEYEDEDESGEEDDE